jgi:homoserine kinase
LGHPADEVALLTIASEIEGHPDNITPAIVGGLVISSQEEDGSVVYSKLNWPEEWKITVCVPDFELSTGIARSVLPEEVPMKDAIFNAKRMAMFVDAVNKKDSNLMKLALQDKLHQPYRMKLVPGFDSIMENLRHFDNVLGVVLSGAGSSILVISEKNNVDKIYDVVRETWANQNIKCTIKTLSVENSGAQIISNEN